MKKIISFCILLLSCTIRGWAQLPTEDKVYFISMNEGKIYTYDPTLPLSATNPSENSIPLPAGPYYCSGLAVSEVLGSGNNTLTFYTTVIDPFDFTLSSSILWYYNPATQAWVNTNCNLGAGAVNLASGGGYIFSYTARLTSSSTSGGVYRYDAANNSSTLIISSEAFSGDSNEGSPAYDLIADCTGNFYFLMANPYFPHVGFLKKYDANGTFLQQWQVNNPLNLFPTFGFGSINDTIYIFDQFNMQFSVASGILDITGNPLNFNTNLGSYASISFLDHDDVGTAAMKPNLPLQISISADHTTICPGDAVTLTTSLTNSGSNPQFQWYVNGGEVANATGSSYTYTPNDGDVVNCSVIRPTEACLSTKSAESNAITITLSHVIATIQPKDTAICPGDTITLVASGAVNYTWLENDNMTSDQSIAKVWPTQTTVYKVIVANEFNCKDSAIATVSLKPIPFVDAGPDMLIAAGASVRLNGTATGSISWQYNVSTPNILNPIVAPTNSTIYYLTVTDASGCKASDSVKVYVVSTGLPNAFSPNGDGLNDEFRIIFNSDGKLIPMSLSIYNRWGEKVFYTINADKGWDGTYNGKSADAGTYFYNVRYSIGDKEYERKGDLTLIR